MIHIKATSPVNAWHNVVKELYASPETQGELWKDQIVVVELENINPNDYYDPNFPMTQQNVDDINHYLVTGENEDKVIHEWTKIYRHRLFGTNYNQIEQVIEYLKKKPHGLRAQASVWNQEVDLYGKIGPCFQLAWFRVSEQNKLDIHIHMRASDGYGKILMNINEFVALQKYVAQSINVESGTYIHFIDSCHFNLEDKDKVSELIQKIA